MALTGRFEADFESFYAAVDQADVKLRAFESTSEQVGKSLDAMVNQFSPVKAIEDATLMAEAVERIGGAAKLTKDQLDEVAATIDTATTAASKWGMELPESIQKVRAEVGEMRSSWSTFLEGFDLEKAIKHPLDAAGDAAVALTGELGPMGMAAVAAAGGLATVGKAAWDLSVATAETGEHLGNLADRTGLSVATLSRYSDAVEVAGGSLSTLTNGLGTFERLAAESTGSDKFARGLERIGLSLDQVRSMTPDALLNTLVERFAAIEDPAQRAAAGAELFRDRSGAMVGTLRDLTPALERVRDIDVWTPEKIAAAKEFDMHLRDLKVHASEFGTTIGNDLIPWMDRFLTYAEKLAGYGWRQTGFPQFLEQVGSAADTAGTALEQAGIKGAASIDKMIPTKSISDGTVAMHDFAQAVNQGTEAGKHLTDDAMTKAAAATKELEAWTKKWTEAMQEAATAGKGYQGIIDEIDGATVEGAKALLNAGMAAKDVGVIYELNAVQLKALEQARRADNDAAKQAADASEKYAAALTGLLSIGKDYHATLDAIDGETVEAIKYYLQQGESVEHLATVYKLTAEQIKAVQLAMRDEQAQAKLEEEQLKTAAKLWNDYFATVEEGENKSLGGRLHNIDVWLAKQSEALKLNNKWSQDAQNALDSIAAEKTEKEITRTLESDKRNKEYWDKRLLEAQTTYEQMEAHSSRFTAQQIDDAGKALLAAQDDLSKWETAANTVFVGTKNAAGDVAEALKRMDQGIATTADHMAVLAAQVRNNFPGGQLPKGGGGTVEERFGQEYWTSPYGEQVPLGPGGQIPQWWQQQHSWMGNLVPAASVPGGTPIGAIPGRAVGGPVTQGSPYIVGERGPELFVPTVSGTIVPNQQNTFNLVDTESNLARKVADIIMQRIRDGVKLGSI